MKHLKTAVSRTKTMPFACMMACLLAITIKMAFPQTLGVGNILLLGLILFILIAIFDLIYAYMRDMVKD